jgi:hypothetical protein
MTGVGLLTFAVVTLLGFFHVVVPDTTISQIIVDVIKDGGLVLGIIGQLRRPDLKWGLKRRVSRAVVKQL